MRTARSPFFALPVLLAAALPAAAIVKPAGIFASNMVLQRDMSVPVWGTASPGELVTVAFAGQSVSVFADASGKWTATLAPLAVFQVMFVTLSMMSYAYSTINPPPHATVLSRPFQSQ